MRLLQLRQEYQINLPQTFYNHDKNSQTSQGNKQKINRIIRNFSLGQLKEYPVGQMVKLLPHLHLLPPLFLLWHHPQPTLLFPNNQQEVSLLNQNMKLKYLIEEKICSIYNIKKLVATASLF